MATDSLTVRSLKIRLLLPLTLVLTVVVIGTLGYRWLWRDVGGTQLGHHVAVDAGLRHAVSGARNRPAHEVADPEAAQHLEHGTHGGEEVGVAHGLREARSARNSPARSSP